MNMLFLVKEIYITIKSYLSEKLVVCHQNKDDFRYKLIIKIQTMKQKI